MKTIEELFEVHGYFEEIGIQIGDRYRSLGTRTIEKPTDRPLGAGGTRHYTIEEPLTLVKGHRSVVIKASKNRPLVCFGIANALCGRAKT